MGLVGVLVRHVMPIDFGNERKFYCYRGLFELKHTPGFLVGIMRRQIGFSPLQLAILLHALRQTSRHPHEADIRIRSR